MGPSGCRFAKRPGELGSPPSRLCLRRLADAGSGSRQTELGRAGVDRVGFESAHQIDVSGGPAIAVSALIAGLPEYTVDLYYAWTAGHDPAYIQYTEPEHVHAQPPGTSSTN